MSKFAPHRRAGNNPRATSSTVCQKCLRPGSSSVHVCNYRRTEKITGHFTYECKDTRPYVSRPSRTAQLENPQLLLAAAAAKSKADVDPSSVPDEFKNKFVFLKKFCWTQCVFLRIVGVDRSGTANRILEAKEKQREKEKEKTDRATKRTKR
jgi:hypothetical protein